MTQTTTTTQKTIYSLVYSIEEGCIQTIGVFDDKEVALREYHRFQARIIFKYIDCTEDSLRVLKYDTKCAVMKAYWHQHANLSKKEHWLSFWRIMCSVSAEDIDVFMRNYMQHVGLSVEVNELNYIKLTETNQQSIQIYNEELAKKKIQK
jgi:hypothetical protein